MKTKAKDFIEFDFTARIKDDAIFDTTMGDVALKEGLIQKEDKERFKPMRLCIGEGMVVKGLDIELEDKEIGKEYSISLNSEQSFGKRQTNLIKTFPISAFKQMPYPGMIVNVDGLMAKILSVNSGRAMMDFNNPLSGKDIIYYFIIRRIISDNKEKLDAFIKAYGIKIKSIESEGDKGKILLDGKYPKQVIEEISKKIKEVMNISVEFS